MSTTELPALYVDSVALVVTTPRLVLVNRDPSPGESGVPIEYSLFSQMKTMGSFQSAASDTPSWKPPMLTAPSPK